MILMALFHRAEKDIPAVVDWLSQALKLAAPEGFIRIFLDEGEALLDLLSKARQAVSNLILRLLVAQPRQLLDRQHPQYHFSWC